MIVPHITTRPYHHVLQNNLGQYQKQWVRKIQKDVLATYSAKAPTSPTKAGSSKTGGSPKKRFRQEEKGE